VGLIPQFIERVSVRQINAQYVFNLMGLEKPYTNHIIFDTSDEIVTGNTFGRRSNLGAQDGLTFGNCKRRVIPDFTHSAENKVGFGKIHPGVSP